MFGEKLNLIHPVGEFGQPHKLAEVESIQDRIQLITEQVGGIELSGSVLTAEKLALLKYTLSKYFVDVASDLGTFGLAEGHISRLIDHLVELGAQTELDILIGGAGEFYTVAKDILGPLWAGYVHEVMASGQGQETYLFAARDATPMYWAAEGLVSGNGHIYDLGQSMIVHVDWNRWFMGQEDELEGGIKPMSLDHPVLAKFYRQMGFGNGYKVKIVEPGAWGSAANALRTAMPNQNFELWFMFSHMPEYIYGFLNHHAGGVDEKYMEMINDTAEAMPKAYVRPTELVEVDGLVVADTRTKVIDSPYLKLWSVAVNLGAFDAGVEFSAGKHVNIDKQVKWIVELSKLSAQGVWTGVLPRNTLTWTEGENWRKNWKWGQIPPLK